jgi:predicted Zn finger-like uncharacterized protein
MDVRCERCKTRYEVDDARVTEAGVTVRCTQCQHTFIVKKKALVVTLPVKPGTEVQPDIRLGAEPPPAAPPEPPAAPPPVATAPPAAPTPAPAPPAEKPREREWRVRQANGNIFTCKELTALQRWIVERKVTRDDEISVDGQNWKRLGNIPELAGFFLLLDEAQRAAELQVQARMGMIPPTVHGPSVPVQPGVPGPPPPQEAPPTPQSPSALVSEFRAAQGMRGPVTPEVEPPETPRGKRWLLPVGLVAVLGAAAAGVYFGVLLPREEAAARVLAEQQATQRRLEQARLEQERLAKAEAEAQAAAMAADAGGETPTSGTPIGGDPAAIPPPLDDAGTALDAGLGPDAGDAGGTVAEPTPDAGLADAGTATDAGLADAGLPADAGVADAGTADAGAGGPGKRPAQARDFDSYLREGDRLRERGKAQAAMNAYDKAAELSPDRAEPYAGRGLVHLDLGDDSLAEAEFLRALKLNPRYGVALMGLAETYRSQGKNAQAVRYYERYLDVLPNGPEAAVARSALERLRE